MHPILEQLSKQLGDQVRIVKIDVDKNQQLASQLQVSSVPTLAIFKNGEIVWRQPGVLPANVLSDKLKSFM
jgi:thioredoxin 1